ncbi:MAG TPA: hypothetical protein VNS32_22540 [Flavisolibacter sp.]|nr:hypothetical protein [Flavisolibacter sp.]
MKAFGLLLIAMIISCCSCVAQNNKCELLKVLLNDENARKIFYWDKHNDVPIRFVDIHHYFENCALGEMSGRKICFTNDSTELKIVNYSNIIISGFDKTIQGYKISFYYKIRNALFEAEFRKTSKGLTLKKFTGGFF